MPSVVQSQSSKPVRSRQEGSPPVAEVDVGAVTIYGEAEGSCFACAPKGMHLNEIIEAVSVKNPITDGRWIIRQYRIFVGGEKQGHQCEIDSKCRHWFVEVAA